ncbi:MAG: SDR family oxidoreductase [Candidatus Lustribacter sp.]|jgi:NADP-dependent 3-hydroxy acid dehydrogenase YdfG
MPPSPLTGHITLVTGASSGIGEGVAEALATHGATVVAAARRQDRLEQLVERLRPNGATAIPYALDITNATNVAQCITDVVERYGRIDSVVNCAGIMLSARTAQATVADWQRMFDTNVLGLMAVSHAAFAVMRKQRSGHIVNISSVSARLANPGSPGYAATKSAVNTFSESLRKEGAPENVRVTVISPGIVKTEIFDHLADAATRERFKRMLEGMTPLTPADVAAAVIFALTQPAHVSISEIVLRPTEEIE